MSNLYIFIMKKIAFLFVAVVLLAGCDKEETPAPAQEQYFDKYELLDITQNVLKEVRLTRTATFILNNEKEEIKFTNVDFSDFYEGFYEGAWIPARDIVEDSIYGEKRIALTLVGPYDVITRIRLILKE